MTKTESSSESSPAKELVAVTVTEAEAEDGKTEDDNDAEVNELAASMEQELSIKHPLQHAWTLWYYRNDRTKSWEENLREVVTFDTVEVHTIHICFIEKEMKATGRKKF